MIGIKPVNLEKAATNATEYNDRRGEVPEDCAVKGDNRDQLLPYQLLPYKTAPSSHLAKKAFSPICDVKFCGNRSKRRPLFANVLTRLVEFGCHDLRVVGWADHCCS